MDGSTNMKNEYDFSKMKSVKNPYAKMLKKQITIKITDSTVEYFKDMAKETGMKYQSLINIYLTDCAVKHKKIHMHWK